MPERDANRAVDQFLLDEIDTVPHLEALLLIWNSRSKHWSAEDMGRALYLSPDSAKEILEDLVRRGLISSSGPLPDYYFQPEPDRDELLAAVNNAYQKDLIHVSRLIHSKPSAAIREFARAFRIKKGGSKKP